MKLAVWIVHFLVSSYLSFANNVQNPSPSFPLQLSANIEISAHLIEESQEYPPKKRRMTIYYDYIHKLARADIDEGYEAAKSYIRRYDAKQEYMVRHPPIEDCKRSYLGDIMPFPDIPNAKFIGIETVNGKRCNYFLHSEDDARVHIYFESSTGAPVRLIQEAVENGVSTPMLTYDYTNVVLGAPPMHHFNIPDPHSHNTCERYAGGFPYIHAFHYFVRF